MRGRQHVVQQVGALDDAIEASKIADSRGMRETNKQEAVHRSESANTSDAMEATKILESRTMRGGRQQRRSDAVERRESERQADALEATKIAESRGMRVRKHTVNFSTAGKAAEQARETLEHAAATYIQSAQRRRLAANEVQYLRLQGRGGGGGDERGQRKQPI
jgi:hypothetical protein